MVEEKEIPINLFIFKVNKLNLEQIQNELLKFIYFIQFEANTTNTKETLINSIIQLLDETIILTTLYKFKNYSKAENQKLEEQISYNINLLNLKDFQNITIKQPSIFKIWLKNYDLKVKK